MTNENRVYATDSNGQTYGPPAICAYFALCDREATHVRALPFGNIPTCDRCGTLADS